MNLKSFPMIVAVFSLLILGSVSQCATAANPKVTIRYWFWCDPPEKPVFDNLVKEFNESHPAVKVKAEHIPWDTMHQMLITAIAGGSPPVASRVHINWMGELAKMGALESLNNYVDVWPGAYDVQEEIWELLKVKGLEEKKYVVPFKLVALYLYYRQDWFRKKGLTPPTNYKEFLEVAKALTEDNNDDGKIDQWGYGMRGARGGHDMWNTFVKFFNRDGSINRDKTAVTKATKWYADLFREWKVCPPSAPSDGFAQYTSDFWAGRTAMIIHHIGSSPTAVKALGDKVKAFVVPEGLNGGYTSAVPEGNAILTGASGEERKAAFEFISWFAEHEQINRFCRETGSAPVLKSVAKLSYYQENPFQKATVESMKYAGSLPTVPETGSFIEDVWPVTFGKVLLSEITTEEAVDAFYNHYGVTPK